MKPTRKRSAQQVLVVLAAMVVTGLVCLSATGSWAVLFWMPVLFAMVGVAVGGAMARSWKFAVLTVIVWMVLEVVAVSVLMLTGGPLALVGTLFVPWTVAVYVAATRVYERSESPSGL